MVSPPHCWQGSSASLVSMVSSPYFPSVGKVFSEYAVLLFPIKLSLSGFRIHKYLTILPFPEVVITVMVASWWECLSFPRSLCHNDVCILL